MNKLLITIGIITVVFGLVFSVLPHSLHNYILGYFTAPQSNAHDHGSHESHVSSGLVISIIGIGMCVAGWKILD